MQKERFAFDRWTEEREPENKIEEGYGLWQEHGKEEVNKLLWMWLPGNMTLFEAEDLAAKIYSMITNEWIKRHPDEKDDEA